VPAPALRHLGVVGVPGTVGAAVAVAASRAAAERRFEGAEPRFGMYLDPRHPAGRYPQGRSA
jgi:hypothetical protein